MKHISQLAIFLLILLSTINCFTSEIKVDSLNKLDPNSKFNGFQDINIPFTGDEGVFVDIDDKSVFRDQINYKQTPNVYSNGRDELIYQLSRDILIDKPMARLSFKLDIPYRYIYSYNNYYTFSKVAILFGNDETEIGFGFFGKADRAGLNTYNEYFADVVTGTVFNVPIGIHPIKFKVINTTNINWMKKYFYSNSSWGRMYAMMDVEGEILKPAKIDKKAPLIVPKDETSEARPAKNGRLVSTGYYYSYPYTYTYNHKSRQWRYTYRMPWSQYNYPWSYTNYGYRKVHSHDATEGETFAMYVYYPNAKIQATFKGTLSYYDKEGWWGIKHTDEDWMCNQGLSVERFNNNSYYKLKQCSTNSGYTKSKGWRNIAGLTQAKWLTYSHQYKYFFWQMYTIPKSTKKSNSAIYISPNAKSTIKITAKGKTITLKNAVRNEVNGVYESQFKKALKSKDKITIEVDSGKQNAWITGVINYKDSTGYVRLLSADLYMKCGKGQETLRIKTQYSEVNIAPLITLLSDRARYYIGKKEKKIKCTITLP